ncbi:MAG: extracellular solute-binding protein [Clostridiaceae bacterium]|nr:extracellular solute-binding protein [Eubacteriales bacterium]
MRFKSTAALLIFMLLLNAVFLPGCGSAVLDPGDPVTVSLWHNYGGQMKETMDALVSEFNDTVGREQGVIVNVTSISSSSSIVKMLDMAANGEPGAPALPDVTTCYPITALSLKEKGLLVDLKSYFSGAELGAYLPAFLAEGYIGSELYVFPVAKSTEVLFLNRTLFDRFSAATGVTLESLSTFEGLASAAKSYYEWTDSLTPDTANDGKSFYMPDSWFNLAQVGAEQLGESLVKEQAFNLSTNAFSRVFETLYRPAVAGGVALSDSYSSELMKTGDLVCSTGSTAGVLFYGDSITYPDNTTEKVTFDVLPYPVFEGGEKVALQRGGGMCVFKSDARREYAACLFIKWFTRSKQNERFVSSTGYLPVTREAFVNVGSPGAPPESENVKKLLATASQMLDEYRFYLPPVFDGFDAMGADYTANLKSSVMTARETYAALLSEMGAEGAYAAASKEALSDFIQSGR